MTDRSCSVCVTSFLRFRYIYVLAISEDITWDNVDSATWSSIEINVAIICACLPTLKPLITSFAPCLLSSPRSCSLSLGTPSNGRMDRFNVNHNDSAKPPDGLSSRTKEVKFVDEEDNNQGRTGGIKGVAEFELEVLSRV